MGQLFLLTRREKELCPRPCESCGKLAAALFAAASFPQLSQGAGTQVSLSSFSPHFLTLLRERGGIKKY